MIIFQVIENIKNGGKEENECVIKVTNQLLQRYFSTGTKKQFSLVTYENVSKNMFNNGK